MSNPRRAATWTVAAIALVGVVAGMGIAATTRSANGPDAPDGLAAPAASSASGGSGGSASAPGGAPVSSVAGLEAAKAVATAAASPRTAATHAPAATHTQAAGSDPPVRDPASPPHDPAPPGADPGSPATTTATAPATAPGPCTAGDVTVTTATDASSYPAGAPVTITTTIRDTVACVVDPVPAGPYDCGVGVTVENGAGAQVWPVPGQSEQCAQPPVTALSPGTGLSVRVVWTGLSNVPGTPADVPAPPGRYTAAGTWSWSGPLGQTLSVTGVSLPFAVA